MKRTSKVVLVVVVLTLFSFVLSLSAFAATDTAATELPVPPELPVFPAVVSPQGSDLVLSMVCDIFFNENYIATASAAVRCKAGTAAIDGALIVYEKVDGEWEILDRVNGTGTRDASFELDFPYDSEVEYKAVLFIVVYDSNMSGTLDSRVCEKTAP